MLQADRSRLSVCATQRQANANSPLVACQMPATDSDLPHRKPLSLVPCLGYGAAPRRDAERDDADADTRLVRPFVGLGRNRCRCAGDCADML